MSSSAGRVLVNRSANGKRFARKDADGCVSEAREFDLSSFFGPEGKLMLNAQRILNWF